MNVFEKHLEDPSRLRRIKLFFYGSLVLIALAEFVVVFVLGLGHGHFSFETWPCWGSLYGLFSCAVIVVVSKFLGHRWLMRKEGYYD